MKEILPYREKPLTADEFRKLEDHSKKFMAVREKTISKSVPKLDNDGNVYGWERDLVAVGSEVFFKSEPDEKTMEAIMRPATDVAIGVHLQNLYDHRPYARGNEGWKTVVRDLIHDLKGCSEWALIKTCEKFRQQTGERFFPLTADLIHAVKGLDEQVRWAYAGRPSAKSPEPKAPQITATTRASTKQRRRVGKAMGLLAKKMQGRTMTRWELRFFNALNGMGYRKRKPSGHNFGYGE